VTGHTHRWRQKFEEALTGGCFPIGWECIDCKRFMPQHALTPSGLDGVVMKGASLMAPHGRQGVTSSGNVYSEQIVDEDGHLRIL